MNSLTKIREAGFHIGLNESGLVVSPFSKLTPLQVLFLKSHKAEIIQALKQEQAASEAHAPEDDRHHCHECKHLDYLNRCKASTTRYSQVDTHPRRCADYLGAE